MPLRAWFTSSSTQVKYFLSFKGKSINRIFDRIVAAEELYSKRKTEHLITDVSGDRESSSSTGEKFVEPLAKRPRSDDSDSSAESSPGTWSFSSGGMLYLFTELFYEVIYSF